MRWCRVTVFHSLLFCFPSLRPFPSSLLFFLFSVSFFLLLLLGVPSPLPSLPLAHLPFSSSCLVFPLPRPSSSSFGSPASWTSRIFVIFSPATSKMSSQRVVFLCGNAPVWEARGQRAEGARIKFLALSPCSSLQLPVPPHVHAPKHANRVLHGIIPRALHVSVSTDRECLSLQKILPVSSRPAHKDLSSPAVCLFFLGLSRLCVETMLVACSAHPRMQVWPTTCGCMIGNL